MTAARLASTLVHTARDLDMRWQRVMRPDLRNVLFDARTSMEYGMMAPVHRRLLRDARMRTWLVSSERPQRAQEIFRDAPPNVPILSPRAAMLRRFDAYIAADFVWANLPRGTCRVQMFHGVAGKWSQIYDRPAQSMRQWDRLFFINRRRLQNYIASGAIENDSPAIRLVGMPKSDCLVDGSLNRDSILQAHGIDPARPTVLYAPTWTRFSSLTVLGEELVGRLVEAGYTVLVKLHDNSLDRSYINSGGVDWLSRLPPILARGHGHLIRASDASPWLVGADVLISDHSSIGFEYLLLDRPLVRIEVPDLLKGADIGNEYVQLIARAATSVTTAAEAVEAVAEGLEHPSYLSSERRALGAELFYGPGHATERAVRELYALIELQTPQWISAPAVAQEVGSAAEGVLSR